jgi:hypothetical protein
VTQCDESGSSAAYKASKPDGGAQLGGGEHISHSDAYTTNLKHLQTDSPLLLDVCVIFNGEHAVETRKQNVCLPKHKD